MRESKISRREFGLLAAAAGLGAMATGGCDRATKPETFSEADLRALEASLDTPIQNGELPGLPPKCVVLDSLKYFSRRCRIQITLFDLPVKSACRG